MRLVDKRPEEEDLPNINLRIFGNANKALGRLENRVDARIERIPSRLAIENGDPNEEPKENLAEKPEESKEKPEMSVRFRYFIYYECGVDRTSGFSQWPLHVYIQIYKDIIYRYIKKKVAEKIAEEIKTQQGNVVADRKVCPNYYKISMQRCRPLILHAHAFSKTHI